MNKKSILLIAVVIVLSVVSINTIVRAQSGNPPASIPSAKATFEAQENVIEATHYAVPIKERTPVPLNPNASCPSTPPAVGILVGNGHGPFASRDTINNQAVVRSNAGFYYEVWAGAAENHPDQGLIRLIEDDPDYCASSVKGTVFPPMRDFIYPKGPITLTRVEGEILVFSVPGGGTARFNVVTDQFLP